MTQYLRLLANLQLSDSADLSPSTFLADLVSALSKASLVAFDQVLHTLPLASYREITQGGLGSCTYFIAANLGTVATQVCILQLAWATGATIEFAIEPGKILILPWMPMISAAGPNSIKIAHDPGTSTETPMRIIVVP